MKLISVTAPCNGSGKTNLILAILRSFPGCFTAMKFTTIYRDGNFCPRTERSCACRSLEGAYTICTDREVLEQEATDTGYMSAAGARRVIWCLSRPNSYTELCEELQSGYLSGRELILGEGNLVTRTICPMLRFFVVNPLVPEECWKSDWREFFRLADLVIVNAWSPEGGWRGSHDPTVSKWCAAFPLPDREAIVVANVASPLEDWADQRTVHLLTHIVNSADREDAHR